MKKLCYMWRFMNKKQNPLKRLSEFLIIFKNFVQNYLISKKKTKK